MRYTVITDINKIDRRDWDLFVQEHPNGTVFQSSETYFLFKNAQNFEPVPVLVSDDKGIKGVLLAVIIKEYSSKIGFFTSRTVIYGGPLIDPSIKDISRVLDLLLKELIKKVKNKSIFIQFRNFFEWSEEYKDVFTQNGFQYLERLNFLVDTSTEQLVKKRMSKSKLRQIRKGLEAGAEIIEPENIEQVREFYNILYYLYKYRVKKPLPKWSFFESFYQQSKENKLGIIRLIKYDNKIIGGILSPVFPGKVIYEWYVCGLDLEYKHVYPSILATWAAIDYALKNNIRTFDFMGVGVPDKDYGVRDFKAKFGGEQVNYGRFGRINNKFLYAITEIGFNLLALLRRI
ncbi:MAG: peptidoglycan bridge formation glycyltransferase FemA/FemB family protein [Bacteroidetes bacterium]|nr:peptidoglycan bridge formation glycyltransferase FemA/FemB family protein [Bacteroidota bacterium]